MVFASQEKRMIYARILMFLAFDFMLLLLLVQFTNEKFTVVFLWLMLLEVGYIILAAKGLLYRVLFFAVYGAKISSGLVIDFLRMNKFPFKDIYLGDPLDYYALLVDDKELPIETRLAAAKAVGALSTLKELTPFLDYRSVSRAHERAFEEYFKPYRIPPLDRTAG